jgi:hypothetical protein
LPELSSPCASGRLKDRSAVYDGHGLELWGFGGSFDTGI